MAYRKNPPFRFILTLLYFFAALSLAGCGNLINKFSQNSKPGYTTVFLNRTRDGLNIKDVLIGGVKVYAMTESLDRAKGITLASESGAGVMSLPNGSYTFSAIGWDGGNLKGNTYCGLGKGPADASGTASSGAIVLDGTPITIDLLLTEANCTTNDFSDSSFRNATNYLPLSISFCGAATDTSGFSYGSDCTHGHESWAFLSGNSTAQFGDVRGDPNNYLFFSSNALTSSQYELYSTNYFTAAVNKEQVKISGANTTGAAGVTKFSPTPDFSHVVYVADSITAGKKELFVAEAHYQAPIKVGTSQTTPGITDFRVTPDSETIVYVSDETAAGKYEIYAVGIDGTNKRTLYSITSAVGGSAGVANGASNPVWDMSPDGNYILFAADKNHVAANDIFKVNISGTPNVVQLHASIPASSTGAFFIEATPDSQYAVVAGDLTTPTINEVFAVNLSGTPAPVTISPTLGVGGISSSGLPSSNSNIMMDRDRDDNSAGTGLGTGTIAFRAAPYGYLFSDLFVVKESSFTTAHSAVNRTNLQTNFPGLSGSADGVNQIYFNSNATQIAYVLGNGSAYHLYVVGTSSGTPIRMSDPSITGSGGIVVTGYNTHFKNVEFINDDTQIIFLQQVSVSSPGNVFSNDTSTGSTLTNISNLSGGTVVHVSGLNEKSATSGQFVYLANSSVSPSTYNLFYKDLNSAAAPYQVNSALATSNSINDCQIVDNDRIFYRAILSGNTEEEVYIYSRSAGTNTQVTKTYGGGSPIGRFQIHMVDFEANAGGGFVSMSPNPVTDSLCYAPTAADGGVISFSPSIYIPTGISSGIRPFGVAIEVYPYATSCSPGTGIVHFFPFGLARPDETLFDQKSKLTGDGSSNLHLFISDY